MNPNQTPQSIGCAGALAPHSPPPLSPYELSDRLVPLCDGRPGLRATLPIEAQLQQCDQASPGAHLPVIDFASSDATLDRYDEMIRPEGWRLENYRRNPVFQNAHQYGDIIFTLGKALITEIRAAPSPHLFQRVEFAVDVNPMARIAYGLYKNKFLNAVSVGFIPIRWENGDGTQHTSREFSDTANLKSRISNFPLLSEQTAIKGDSPLADRRARRTYLEQELLEVSAVGIPANPEALQLGLKAGAIETTDLKALLELLLENAEGGMKKTKADFPSIHPSTIPSRAFCLLSLARVLRDVLRRS
jgi:hypothetical protein